MLLIKIKKHPSSGVVFIYVIGSQTLKQLKIKIMLLDLAVQSNNCLPVRQRLKVFLCEILLCRIFLDEIAWMYVPSITIVKICYRTY